MNNFTQQAGVHLKFYYSSFSQATKVQSANLLHSFVDTAKAQKMRASKRCRETGVSFGTLVQKHPDLYITFPCYFQSCLHALSQIQYALFSDIM